MTVAARFRSLALAFAERFSPLAWQRACEREFDALYRALYEMAHDPDQAAAFASRHTVAAFQHQWTELPSGKFMLSNPEFKRDVADIIAEQEIQIDRAWFAGKRVLDAGCGGGRWSYGLARLGAHVTAVDANGSAIEPAAAGLRELSAPGDFVQSDLESLAQKLQAASFDLVWSWGVLHHCASFTGALASLTQLLRPGGLLFLYLWPREHLPCRRR